MFFSVFGALCTYSPRAKGWQCGLGALLAAREISCVNSAFDEVAVQEHFHFLSAWLAFCHGQ